MARENRYYDASAAVQVIGCVLVDQTLLDRDGQYFFNKNDFANDMHRVVFGAVSQLHDSGAQRVNIKSIEDYLSTRQDSSIIYKSHSGGSWVQQAIDAADLPNFDYYYGRLKKMTLLRGYDKAGVDVTWLLDPDNLVDAKRKQEQEDYLDSLTLNQMSDIIDNRILTVRDRYVDNATEGAVRLGNNVESLLSVLTETPEMGAHLYGRYMDTITRGARRGKYYLRSAPTGIGNIWVF